MSDQDNGAPDGGADGQDPRAIPRTVFNINPGGRIPEQDAAPALRAGLLDALEAESSRPGVNRLVDEAADLFDLVVYLRDQMEPVSDINKLRDKAIALIKQFQKRALAEGEPSDTVQRAVYTIAATVDDQVMSRPWGMDHGWHQRKLVDVLFREVIGGEKFFEILDFVKKNPAENKSLIEFMYICLSLGFQGTFGRRDQLSPTDAADHLRQYRLKTYRTVEQSRGGQFADALSIRWRGVNTRRRPISDLLPTWLMAALSLLLMVGLFVMFLLFVSEETSESYAKVQSMPPSLDGVRQPVEVRRLEVPTERPKVEIRPDIFERVRAFLEPEIEEGLVEVYERGGEVRILLVGDGMFDSGKIEIKSRYHAVLERVSTALNDEPGDVLIEGHTDPIKPNRKAKYPTNLVLSEERARAVGAFMIPYLDEPERLSIIGYAATQPLPDTDNSTPEGRARNRRVELLLIRPEPTPDAEQAGGTQ